MTSTQPSAKGSAARQAQANIRLREEANLERATKAAEAILAAENGWLSPWNFLYTVASTGKVDQYTAQVAFDNLTSSGKMEFVSGQGVRSIVPAH